MANVIFTLGASTFTFSKGRDFPIQDPVEVAVVTDQSEGGNLYCYDKGVTVQYFNLYYKNLIPDDYTNVANWIQSVCVGPLNTFTYTDEDGATHTVRCLDTINPLKETGYQLYSGTIRLREEI